MATKIESNFIIFESFDAETPDFGHFFAIAWDGPGVGRAQLVRKRRFPPNPTGSLVRVGSSFVGAEAIELIVSACGLADPAARSRTFAFDPFRGPP
ncbi:hypothetical protein [Amorphus sp. 3PC139-8]|uniref:hypothetical protein n=1 Tax=Amorphus sp. 3PC139-8 TaxID=2735676 RepID=UPI00345C72F8